MSIAGLHDIQELSPAPLVDMAGTYFTAIRAMTQLLAWAWASQAQGPAKLLLI